MSLQMFVARYEYFSANLNSSSKSSVRYTWYKWCKIFVSFIIAVIGNCHNHSPSFAYDGDNVNGILLKLINYSDGLHVSYRLVAGHFLNPQYLDFFPSSTSFQQCLQVQLVASNILTATDCVFVTVAVAMIITLVDSKSYYTTPLFYCSPCHTWMDGVNALHSLSFQ